MKKIISFLVFLCFVSVAYSLEECTIKTYVQDVPCRVSTTWELPSNCANYSVMIFDEEGNLTQAKNLTALGASGLCQFLWDIRQTQCYTYNISQGDYGSVCVVTQDSMLSTMLFNLFLIILFVLIGLPFKYGFLKFFSWSMGFIQVFFTMWIVYLSYVGKDFSEFIFTYYFLITIILVALGIFSLYTANRKLMDLENNPYKKDAYSKWSFGK